MFFFFFKFFPCGKLSITTDWKEEEYTGKCLFAYAVTVNFETYLLRNVGQDAPVHQFQLSTKFII